MQESKEEVQVICQKNMMTALRMSRKKSSREKLGRLTNVGRRDVKQMLMQFAEGV